MCVPRHLLSVREGYGKVAPASKAHPVRAINTHPRHAKARRLSLIGGKAPGRTGSGEPDARIRCLANVEQVHHENQGLAGLNNRARTAVTVGHVGGNLQATTAANLHAEQTLIPAADNLANAHLER